MTVAVLGVFLVAVGNNKVLSCRLIKPQPQSHGGELSESDIVVGDAVAAGSDAAKLLELLKQRSMRHSISLYLDLLDFPENRLAVEWKRSVVR